MLNLTCATRLYFYRKIQIFVCYAWLRCHVNNKKKTDEMAKKMWMNSSKSVIKKCVAIDRWVYLPTQKKVEIEIFFRWKFIFHKWFTANLQYAICHLVVSVWNFLLLCIALTIAPSFTRCSITIIITIFIMLPVIVIISNCFEFVADDYDGSVKKDSHHSFIHSFNTQLKKSLSHSHKKKTNLINKMRSVFIISNEG